MSDEYTPTTEDIGRVYAQETNDDAGFDRWLRDHDAKVRAEAVTKDTSDGYHTFEELYEYRMLYNAHAAHGWLAAGIPVIKSWRHSDGEEAFGGGWFIVSAQLSTGQVTNHYKAEHWDLFEVPEVEIAPAWDGHTPRIAADRLRRAALRVGANPKENEQ